MASRLLDREHDVREPRGLRSGFDTDVIAPTYGSSVCSSFCGVARIMWNPNSRNTSIALRVYRLSALSNASSSTIDPNLGTSSSSSVSWYRSAAARQKMTSFCR
jgi:hypothetical protein